MTDFRLPVHASDDELAEFADSLNPNLTPAEIRRAFFEAGAASVRSSTLTEEEVEDAHRELEERQLQEHLNNSTYVTVTSGKEDDFYWMTIPELPLAIESGTRFGVILVMVAALREYAEDWEARLRTAPNHAHNEDFVQLVGLSTDVELTRWLDYHQRKNESK
jgi:hypothetical protein